MSPSAIELLDRPIATQAKALRIPEELRLLHEDIDVDRIVLDLVKFGKSKNVNIRASVTACDIELSLEGAHQLTISVRDSGLDLYHSGALSAGIDLNLRGWYWRLVGHEKSGFDITLKFEPRPVAWMRAHKNKIKFARGKTTRAEFILRLIRTIKKKKLKLVCPELHKEQPIAKPEDRDEQDKDNRRGSGLDRDFKLPGFKKPEIRNLGRVLAVGDSRDARSKVQIATMMCVMQESHGKTSATNGTHVGLFQQDPRYWPATRVPEKDAKAWYDKVIPIDRANPKMALTALVESVQRSGQPSEYGKWEDEAKVIVNAYHGGGGGFVTRTRKFQFRVMKGETHYGTAMRLADEVNWRLYTIKDTYHFISEDDLFKGRVRLRISEGRDGVDQIDHKKDGRRKVQEVTVMCRMKMWPAPLGSKVMVDNNGPADGEYLVVGLSRSYFSQEGVITLRKPTDPLPEPAPEKYQVSGDEVFDTKLSPKDGARALVEAAVAIAKRGHPNIIVVSDYRPGSTTTSGNSSDHSSNDSSRAARDIGFRGTDALTGPPKNAQDESVVAIGEAFGRDYGDGRRTIIDTFIWHGWRVQIIWRTPLYGGHMGHIHIGIRKA